VKTELPGLTLAELTDLMKRMGFPAFRAKQLIKYLHEGADFADMPLLPKEMRGRLAEECEANTVTIHKEFPSADGGAKYLYALRDGSIIEGVRMRYSYGDTLCLSTQVGCRMGCAFCASTLDGLARNLTAGEMAGQIACQKQPVGNVVLMGSGEPFDNYDEVVRFLRVIHEPLGLNISMRRVSLSTCGLVPQMLRFAEEGLNVTLAVSLHAPNDDLRKTIMPIAEVYGVADIIRASRVYFNKSGRRIIFEYALIKDVNDSDACAAELAILLHGNHPAKSPGSPTKPQFWRGGSTDLSGTPGMPCHVNLIPLNGIPERSLAGSSKNRVRAFESKLTELGISATVRRSLADDVAGACGQLRRANL
jgi:23S rRNA (adenine2503-C2)-methyltransferase